jgi:hypothetical protein
MNAVQPTPLVWSASRELDCLGQEDSKRFLLDLPLFLRELSEFRWRELECLDLEESLTEYLGPEAQPMALLPEMRMTGRFLDLLMMADRPDSQPEGLLDSPELFLPVPPSRPVSFRLGHSLPVSAWRAAPSCPVSAERQGRLEWRGQSFPVSAGRLGPQC